jgi:hypothetical protein
MFSKLKYICSFQTSPRATYSYNVDNMLAANYRFNASDVHNTNRQGLTFQRVDLAMLGSWCWYLKMGMPKNRCVGRWQEIHHYGCCGRLVNVLAVWYTEVFSSLWCVLVVLQPVTRLLQNSISLLHLLSIVSQFFDKSRSLFTNTCNFTARLSDISQF